MIVIKTKLKKLPEKCNKCKYSYTNSGWAMAQSVFARCHLKKVCVAHVLLNLLKKNATMNISAQNGAL